MTKGTVLVVDNDDTAQSAVADLLKDAGFGVVRVYDAVSALCVEAALLLDAVVAASNVPGMEGTALVRAIRDQNPELPLIFVCKPLDLSAISRQLSDFGRRQGDLVEFRLVADT